MSDFIKSTISTQQNFFDEAGQLVPKGNYYFKLNKFQDNMCIGELKCKGSYGHFVFKPIDMIKMMAIGQSRLARRTQIEEEELPSYDSPVTSPSNFRITKQGFLSSTLTKNTIVNTFENNYEKCSICMQDISNNSKTLICNHVYHRNCINTWLFNANTCPICRRIIQEENVTTTATTSHLPSLTLNVPSHYRQSFPETVRQSRYVVRNTHSDLFSPSYNVSPRTDLDRYRHRRSLDTIRNRYSFS